MRRGPSTTTWPPPADGRGRPGGAGRGGRRARSGLRRRGGAPGRGLHAARRQADEAPPALVGHARLRRGRHRSRVAARRRPGADPDLRPHPGRRDGPVAHTAGQARRPHRPGRAPGPPGSRAGRGVRRLRRRTRRGPRPGVGRRHGRRDVSAALPAAADHRGVAGHAGRDDRRTVPGPARPGRRRRFRDDRAAHRPPQERAVHSGTAPGARSRPRRGGPADHRRTARVPGTPERPSNCATTCSAPSAIRRLPASPPGTTSATASPPICWRSPAPAPTPATAAPRPCWTAPWATPASATTTSRRSAPSWRPPVPVPMSRTGRGGWGSGPRTTWRGRSTSRRPRAALLDLLAAVAGSRAAPPPGPGSAHPPYRETAAPAQAVAEGGRCP